MSWFAISARFGEIGTPIVSSIKLPLREEVMRRRPNRASARAIRLIAPIIALGALCGACSDIYLDRRETVALSAGDAVAANKVVQMIDPWPPGVGKRRIAFNGEKMASAIARYRTNKVTPPQSMTTSAVTPPTTQILTPTVTSTPSGQY